MVARSLPYPDDLVVSLDRGVAGQARAKRTLAVATFRHYMMRARADRTDLAPIVCAPGCILLMGPTGVGKTLLMRQLAGQLGVPVLVASATAFSETGYVGENVDDLVRGLYREARGDTRMTELGIIFLDEVDKLRAAKGGRDVSGRGVQNGLLTLLEGRQVRVSETASVDSGRILYVFAGAFVGVERIIARRIQAGASRPGVPEIDASEAGLAAALAGDLAALGFASDVVHERRPAAPANSLLEQVIPADLARFGMVPELMGRVRSIAVLSNLSREELRHVLCDMEDSPLARETELFRVHGIHLELAPGAIDRILDRALATRTGARGLAGALHAVLDPITAHIRALRAHDVRSVRITAETVDGIAPPILSMAGSVGDLDPDLADELRHEVLDRAGSYRFNRAKMTYGETVEANARGRRGEGGAAGSGHAGGAPPRRGGGESPPNIREHARWWLSPVPDEDEMKRQLIGWKKRGFGWSHAESEERVLWGAFERTRKLADVYRVVREIVERGATLGEFLDSYEECGVPSIRAAMAYMTYRRLARDAFGEAALRDLLTNGDTSKIPPDLLAALKADVLPGDDL